MYRCVPAAARAHYPYQPRTCTSFTSGLGLTACGYSARPSLVVQWQRHKLVVECLRGGGNQTSDTDNGKVMEGWDREKPMPRHATDQTHQACLNARSPTTALENGGCVRNDRRGQGCKRRGARWPSRPQAHGAWHTNAQHTPMAAHCHDVNGAERQRHTQQVNGGARWARLSHATQAPATPR